MHSKVPLCREDVCRDVPPGYASLCQRVCLKQGLRVAAACRPPFVPDTVPSTLRSFQCTTSYIVGASEHARKDLFRFPDGRFAFSKEWADIDLLQNAATCNTLMRPYTPRYRIGMRAYESGSPRRTSVNRPSFDAPLSSLGGIMRGEGKRLL